MPSLARRSVDGGHRQGSLFPMTLKTLAVTAGTREGHSEDLVASLPLISRRRSVLFQPFKNDF